MAAYLADLQEQESVRIPVFLYPVRFLVQVSGVAVCFVLLFNEFDSLYIISKQKLHDNVIFFFHIQKKSPFYSIFHIKLLAL